MCSGAQWQRRYFIIGDDISRDTHTFALDSSDNEKCFCYNQTCKEIRGVLATSGKLSEFSCEHLRIQAREAIYRVDSFSEEEIGSFTVGEKVASSMKNSQRTGQPTVVKLSPKSYAVVSKKTASDPCGYAHVSIDNSQTTNLLCKFNECKGNQGITKQVKRKRICIHLHFVILARQMKVNIDPLNTCIAYSTEKDGEAETFSHSTLLWKKDLESNAIGLSRSSTLKMYMQLSIPYNIPINVINKCYDRSIQSPDG